MKNKLLLLVLLLTSLTAGAQTKTVSVFGDSYSTFEGYLTPSTNAVWYDLKHAANKTDVERVTQTWWHQLIRRNGWRLCVNNSYSGSTICNTGYDGNDYSDRSFVNRMDNLGCPDIIFIFGATNDCWSGAPLGEYQYEGIRPDQLWQFRPAMAYMLAWMKDRYINTELYFILNCDMKEEINESVYTICKHYGVPVITLKNIDKMQGHPSVKGMEQIAAQIEEAINNKQ